MITISFTASAQQQRINSNTSSSRIANSSSYPVNPLVWPLVSWGIAIAGGIVAALLEYFADSENKSDIGKLKKPIILGLISGLIFGIANGSINPVLKDPKSSPVDILYQLGLVFVGVLGIDAVTSYKAKVSERKMMMENCSRSVRESREKAISNGTLFGMKNLRRAAKINEQFAAIGDNSQTVTLTTSQFYGRVHEWIDGQIKSLEEQRQELKKI
jgi:hypothetical protein